MVTVVMTAVTITDRPPAGRLLPGARTAPGWLRPLLTALPASPLPGRLGAQPSADGRPSAVLIAFSAGQDAAAAGRGPDVLLTARAAALRNHAGQPAFPGGRAEPGEDAVATALREAQEETGIDPSSVEPLARLSDITLGHSGHRVTPVVAHWHTPGPVGPVDPGETAAVLRVPIADLVAPANRGRVRLGSGITSPAFAVGGLVVWGFTAMVLDALLELAGWNQPWGPGPELTLPPTDADWRAVRPTADRCDPRLPT